MNIRGNCVPFLCLLFSASVSLLQVLPAQAFYDWQGEKSGGSVHGFAGLAASYAGNPQGNTLYAGRNDATWGADLRLLGETRYAEAGFFEMNVHQSVSSLPDSALATHLSSPTGAERSGFFSWKQHASANSQATLEIDTVNARWGGENLEVIFGRQPVNLATTFYFSPNDFFAPFAAQTFFRVYKPGVDAARCEVRLDDFSQVTLVSVLGYGQDATSGNGWTTGPDWDRVSFLGRFATTHAGFEWAVLGGSVQDHTVTGASLQGEMFEWLGIRAEGHYAAPETKSAVSGAEFAVGLEHQFPGNLTVRVEQYSHGQGYATIDEANRDFAANRLRPGATGKAYSALGISYEFSPLLAGDFLYLKNWTDYSSLLAANFVYSLADEAELAFGLNRPFGTSPDGSDIRSEYGSQPLLLTCEWRLFF